MRLAWLVVAPAVGLAADAAEGMKIYRHHCANCHALHGGGGRGPALNTGVFVRAASDEVMAKMIVDGIAGTDMMGTPLPAGSVRDVVAYVRSMVGQPSARPPGDPVKGAALFGAKGCGGCHMVAGEGGVLGPDLTAIGTRPVEYLRESLVRPDAVVSRRYWTVRFAFAGGAMESGFVMNEDTYQALLLDPAGKLRAVSKGGLLSRTLVQTSTMPSYQTLSEGEIVDLTAYLWTLGGARR